jgi:hypothetical protein
LTTRSATDTFYYFYCFYYLLGFHLVKTNVSLAVWVAVGALSLLASQSAMSGPAGLLPTFTEHNETRAYVAFQWFLGQTSATKPNVVLGFRQTKTDVSNKVTGYDMSYSYSLEKSKSEALRLGYLDGQCSRGLVTAGLGFSFMKKTGLGFAGVVGSHAKAFGEIDGQKNFGAGLELNTLRCAGDRESAGDLPPVPVP